jgi:hypothetical protein|uniref:Uncharacterized protein n=1 Tax=Fagus sylvatica TaxID=28930 RepID=A0A2N9I5U1_FAGSY
MDWEINDGREAWTADTVALLQGASVGWVYSVVQGESVIRLQISKWALGVGMMPIGGTREL